MNTINETLNVSLEKEFIPTLQEAIVLSASAKNLRISTREEYERSGMFLKKIKTVSAIMEKKRKELTMPIDAIKKKVMNFFGEPGQELKTAESILKNAIITYQDEQEAQRKEAEQKFILQAKKEEERKRVDWLRRSEKAISSGKSEKAVMLKEKAQEVYVPAIIPITLPTVSGLSTKTVWKYRINDESKIPRKYLVPNEKMIAKIAIATEGKIDITGIKFYPENILSARKY